MPLLNLYGLSETTGSATIQYKYKFTLDKVGYVAPGGELIIRNPDQNGEGEICMRSRAVMMGYLKNEKATKDAIDSTGFFRSGDQGKFTGDVLEITGRIKELIITAGGENVAPVLAEDAFKNTCTACSNIMCIGENQRFIAALITLKVDFDTETMSPKNTLLPEAVSYFKNYGIDVTKADEACKDPKVIDHIQKVITEVNKGVVSNAAAIKKFKMLPVDFSVPGGELTPTMKLKRGFTEKKY